MIEHTKTYALVGASANINKYGYRILEDLLSAGYHVIPVNPHEQTILGQKVYTSLSDIKEPIDTAILVVPPVTGIKIAEEALNIGVKRIWLQPGAESQGIIDYCHTHGLLCVSACIMVERKRASGYV